jgi:transposase
LARGKMKVKRSALISAALDGRFDDPHGELARMLLDQIDTLTAQIATLTSRIEQLLAAIGSAPGSDPPATGYSHAVAGSTPLLGQLPDCV